MAVQRLTLTQIRDEILRIVGFEDSSTAPWGTDARLYERINQYAQRLPIRASAVARESGININAGTLRFDMWRTPNTALTTSAGSSTVYFPTDYDHYIAFYDVTAKARLEVAQDVDRWHIEELRDKPPGAPEAIEILDFVLNGSTWQRRGTLYPDTPSGITPSITMTYYRLPAVMPGTSPSTEYPDADYKYHALWIYGPVLELMRPSDPAYERYLGLERELLVDLAMTARAL